MIKFSFAAIIITHILKSMNAVRFSGHSYMQCIIMQYFLQTYSSLNFQSFLFVFIDHFACLSHDDAIKLIHLFYVIQFLYLHLYMSVLYSVHAWVTIRNLSGLLRVMQRIVSRVLIPFVYTKISLLLFSIFEFSENLVSLMSVTCHCPFCAQPL